jgi:acetyltransferase-like isoleucine patch superfamily enzyme
MEYISQLPESDSFSYFPKGQSKMRRFNEYFLIDNQLGFTGLNLIHRSYFVFCTESDPESVSSLLTANDNQIGPFCVIEPGCKIQGHTKISESIIMQGSILHQNCSIFKSILGKQVVVKEKAIVRNLSVVGDGVQIPASADIDAQKLSLKN